MTSHGPDVRIRGTAQHVAEKYLQLARDAHTGNDPVAAENYLQHAEHYFRLIAAAQACKSGARMAMCKLPWNPIWKTWMTATIWVVCPIALPLGSSKKRGKP